MNKFNAKLKTVFSILFKSLFIVKLLRLLTSSTKLLQAPASFRVLNSFNLLLFCLLLVSVLFFAPMAYGQDTNDSGIIRIRSMEDTVKILMDKQWLNQQNQTANSPDALTISDLSSQSIQNLAQRLVGPGISISNVSGCTGLQRACGSFSGGTGIIGFEDGVVLSTGDIRSIVGPNLYSNAGVANGTPGDAALNTIVSPRLTKDAAVLQFNFVPTTNIISFQYVFGSEEYNEFANSSFNDVFAFFVNGVNVALIPGTTTAVSINNVNGGNPLGTNAQNPQYYRNNDFQNGTAPLNTELDGVTVVLNVQANVIPNQNNTIKLAIADVQDDALDSVVLIRSGSIINAPATTLSVAPATGPFGGTTNLSATLRTAVGNAPIAGRTINFTLNGNSVGSAQTNSSGVATFTANLSNIAAGTYPNGVGASFAAQPGVYGGSSGTNSLTVTNNCTSFSITPITPTNFPSTGGSGTFNVTVPVGCTWTAQGSNTWIVTSSTGDSNSNSGSYTILPNPDASPRTASISVGNASFSVTQAGIPACTYLLSPTSETIGAASGSYAFNVITNKTNCPWQATSSTPWVHITSSSQSGSGIVNYTVDANNTGSPRPGTITVADKTYNVTQNSLNNAIRTISGKVASQSGGISGVTVTLSGPLSRTAVTDQLGNYVFTNLPPGKYDITPSITGGAFNPGALLVDTTNTDVTDQNFSIGPCLYSLNGSSIVDVPAIESSNSFGFNVSGGLTGRPCDWKATSNVPWIIVSNGGIGNGPGQVNFFVQRNYGAARSGTIAINGQIFTIKQPSIQPLNGMHSIESTCDVILSSNSPNSRRLFVPASGISNTINVTTNPACQQWSAESTDTRWLNVSQAREVRTGNSSISFTVNPYLPTEGNKPRVASINVNSVKYIVVQAPVPAAGCNYTLNPTNNSYGLDYRADRFNVTASGCNKRWNVLENDNDSWLKRVDGYSSGEPNSSGFANFTITKNNGLEERTGTLIVGDKSFTVTQAAATTNANCSYEISSPSQNYSAGQGSGNFIISTDTGCTWSALQVDVPWITVTNGSGSGDGTVSFTISGNPGSSQRPGTITVNNGNGTAVKTYKVFQAGTQQFCSYTITPGFQNVLATGAAGNIQVTKANTAACSQSWTANSNDPTWITVTSGASGNAENGGQVVFIVQTNNTPNQRIGTISVAGQIFTITQNGNSIISRTRFDFDGDGKSDLSLFRPSNGIWYLQQSASGFNGIQFGASTDKIVPADYDGDGRTDVAVFRGNTWYIQRSTLGFTNIQFGATGDIPVPADYDGDGITDVAVYRPSNGTWFLQRSTLGFTGIQFGSNGDSPVIGDFDGDSKADLAVYRPSNGVWYLQQSIAGFTGVQFGSTGDKLVPADYDGDGKTDIAVYRPSTGLWYLNRSTAGITSIQFGIQTDTPVPADYDGDGKTDIGVYRSSTWLLQRSTSGPTAFGFGNSTDQPGPSAFIP